MTHTAHAYVADENILELPCAYACAYLTSENQALCLCYAYAYALVRTGL